MAVVNFAGATLAAGAPDGVYRNSVTTLTRGGLGLTDLVESPVFCSPFRLRCFAGVVMARS